METQVKLCAGRPSYFVVLCRGTKEQAEAMKQELAEFLQKKLKLTLSLDKTRITHIKDGFEFLGYQLISGIGSKGTHVPNLRIPERAVKRAKAKIDTMLKGQTSMSVNAKIKALNRVIRGWCQYYQYASSPSFLFKELEYKVFWEMAHWLGRKYKLSMPEVMRRYRQENTFGTQTAHLMLPTKYKAKRLRFRKAQNPYVDEQPDPRQEQVIDLANVWTGVEYRPGTQDLREKVYIRDGGLCGLCGREVELEKSELHHKRPWSSYRDKGQADRLDNLWLLHTKCHQWITWKATRNTIGVSRMR